VGETDVVLVYKKVREKDNLPIMSFQPTSNGAAKLGRYTHFQPIILPE
jgi:hypothetical protein